MDYPFIRYQLWGDFDDIPRPVRYLYAYNESYSYREDGGITNNTCLGFETKSEALNSRLKFLDTKIKKVEKELGEYKDRYKKVKIKLEIEKQNEATN